MPTVRSILNTINSPPTSPYADLGNRLCEAAKIGNVNAIEELIKYPQFKDISASQLGHVLFFAAQSRHVGVIKKLKGCPQLKTLSADGRFRLGDAHVNAASVDVIRNIKKFLFLFKSNTIYNKSSLFYYFMKFNE